MRSTPVAHRGSHPGSHEFRVRFTRRLRDARIVEAKEAAVVPPPPAPQVPAAVTVPPPTPQPVPVVAQQPTDFWTTNAGREIQADRERIEAVLANVKSTVESIRTERADMLREWQRAAIELALTLTTRLLHEQVEADAFPIEGKVRDMIAQLGDDTAVTVRLNPTDLALLTQRLGGEPLLPDQTGPRLVPDANLGRGDCQVEGRESMLLSDVTRELEEIRDELLRSLKNARS
ncbi:Flagellar assembly protein FliH/Type III secretion system HrpE OS=Terriglobus saanensis (strain ATCC BAA-1853 / DSM 23119 / SP1PR4) GN=AciPR4_1814 PE=4 SV=1: FliH [Gemmata massiliana]|uniref:Flagellar assembly protein FliH n=1 Tax=Gemmata massiliana TaxID=1210884 RepID=A0A6P2D7L1_9BACT|nr:FliH/SctL family protein [Gemmata massiliana]VTR96365.1 Flagellar assembly protein FliH/Type III secretion system HrpE OS=Terriglobus saanensis (strain ATCC BAA-1853 / DSM 23119 / SP1PR4) GN=AciPR4_1814 PE=4 SV=1: FliH [Gemmata massiliana]